MSVHSRPFGGRSTVRRGLSETLVRAWQRPNIVNDRYSLIRPWLFTVARNLAHDHWRARKSRPAEVGDTELVTVAEKRDHIDESVQAHAMRQAMARLSPEHRAVLAQVYYRGLSIVDAAAALGIPAGTVKSRTYYALRSLRLALDELGIRYGPTGEAATATRSVRAPRTARALRLGLSSRGRVSG